MRRLATQVLSVAVLAAWPAHAGAVVQGELELPGVCRSAGIDRSAPVSVQTLSRESIENLPGRSIVDVLNSIRAAPPDFATQLGRTSTPAGREARDFLMGQPPLPPVQWSDMLAGAARRQADDQGARGTWSHTGSDGSSVRDRIQATGLYAPIVAETISLGQLDTVDVVRQLIVDEGVATRAHRADLFSRSFVFAGAACAPHQRYKVICVINFSSAPVQR